MDFFFSILSFKFFLVRGLFMNVCMGGDVCMIGIDVVWYVCDVCDVRMVEGRGKGIYLACCVR